MILTELSILSVIFLYGYLIIVYLKSKETNLSSLQKDNCLLVTLYLFIFLYKLYIDYSALGFFLFFFLILLSHLVIIFLTNKYKNLNLIYNKYEDLLYIYILCTFLYLTYCFTYIFFNLFFENDLFLIIISLMITAYILYTTQLK